MLSFGPNTSSPHREVCMSSRSLRATSRARRRRTMGFWGVVLAMGLGFASGVPGPVPCRAADRGSDSGRAGSGDHPASEGLGAHVDLPDSVLASVGTDRRITERTFQSSWKDRQRGAAASSPTPTEARQFLEVLVDRELLAAEATRQTWTWTPAESASILALTDRLAVAAALDSVLRSVRGPLEKGRTDGIEVSDQEVGIAARDTVMARLAPVWDEKLLTRLTAAWAALPRPTSDSSLAAQLRMISQLPVVAASDTDRVLARSGVGDYRVHELLEAWRKLSPAYRPRVDKPSQLQDLAENGLFERFLRQEAARRHLATRPDIVAIVDRQRENLAIAHYLARELPQNPTPTPADLERTYRAHIDDWAIPTRVRAIRLSLDSRAAADRMALTLRDAAQAESLVVRARRRGVAYRVEASAETDSALFAAGISAGTGVVIGPIRGADGWWTARIESVLPGRTRRLDEVRADVEARWRGEELERLLRVRCDELAKHTRVVYNDRAIERLAAR
jgi:PPIC-type PPIASE domain